MTMTHTLRGLTLAASFWLLIPAAQGAPVTFSSKALCVEGVAAPLEVEVAETQVQRNRGLMQRERLAEDAGMLFLFEGNARERAMWMKNTLIPLDMLFIDGGGKIVRIEQRTVPHSLRAIRSGEPAIAVLELNAGTTSRLAIEPGDRVIHPAFD